MGGLEVGAIARFFLGLSGVVLVLGLGVFALAAISFSSSWMFTTESLAFLGIGLSITALGVEGIHHSQVEDDIRRLRIGEVQEKIAMIYGYALAISSAQVVDPKMVQDFELRILFDVRAMESMKSDLKAGEPRKQLIKAWGHLEAVMAEKNMPWGMVDTAFQNLLSDHPAKEEEP